MFRALFVTYWIGWFFILKIADRSAVNTPVKTQDTMKKRPLSVTIIGCIFIAAGVIGFAYHITEFKIERPFELGIILVSLVRLLAILGGVFVLLGRNWARWLLPLWLAFHVILSLFHSWPELIMHCLLFVIVAYLLFRPKASAYFRAGE